MPWRRETKYKELFYRYRQFDNETCLQSLKFLLLNNQMDGKRDWHLRSQSPNHVSAFNKTSHLFSLHLLESLANMTSK